jgi:peptidoglycan/xylan/chitin deacetylase (PgdA/CDA1 family)
VRIPGKKWLRQNARWLKSRWTGGALILGYHRVAPTGNDYYDMCVSPENFEQQLSILREAATPITLEQFVESQHTKTLPPRSVVITFDDGYIDNLQNARPLLKQYQVPAILFVATGYFGRLFWWDELAQLIKESVNPPKNLNLNLNGQIIQWDVVRESEAKTNLLQEIYQLLLPLDEKSRQDLLAQLHEWAGFRTSLVEESDMRCMVESEIKQIARDEVITIGAHTVTHPRLTDLPTEGQQLEIDQSKNRLQKIIDRPVKYFSYPNGAYNETTKSLLKRAGFTAACASYNDIARPGTDPFILPRFWVPNLDGVRFGRWLKHWLA